ncbi:MAG: hypothetical protein ACI4I9_07895 [Porcipelethomonas sp.]
MTNFFLLNLRTYIDIITCIVVKFLIVYLAKGGFLISQFSDFLKENAVKKKISIKSISEINGTERTFLHKIFNGKRKPPNKEFVHSMAKVLMLSNAETATLFELYDKMIMGQISYERRNTVISILNEFYNSTIEENSSIPFRTDIDLSTLPSVITAHSNKSFIKNFHHLLSYEMQNNSNVFMIAQPSKHLNSVISLCLSESYSGIINHIICFDNTFYQNDQQLYNLNIFKYILELASKHYSYKPVFYYDNAETHINSMTTLPIVILTDNFIFLSDETLDEGIIHNSTTESGKEIYEFYKHTFNKMLNSCQPLYSGTSEKSSLFEMIDSLGYGHGDIICYGYQPSFIIYFDKEIYENNIIIPDELKESLYSILEKHYLCYQKKNHSYSIFTMSGLKKFLYEGVYYSLPESSYRLPSYKDRYKLLKSIIFSTQQNLFQYRLVNDNLLHISEKFSFDISEYENSTSYMTFAIKHPNKNHYMIYKSNEQCITYSFKDFLEYIIDSKFTLTQDETVLVLQSTADEFYKYITDNGLK